MEIKRSLSNSISPMLTYGSKTRTWYRTPQSRVHAIEMSYLRGICEVTRWDGDSNEGVYERCGMGTYGNGVVWSVE